MDSVGVEGEEEEEAVDLGVVVAVVEEVIN